MKQHRQQQHYEELNTNNNQDEIQRENNKTLTAVTSSELPPSSLFLSYTFELYGDHLVYLSMMQERYQLSSISTTVSIIVDYVIHLSAYQQSKIFTIIRCKRCGIRFPKKLIRLELSIPHLSFLLHQQQIYHIIDLGKVLRIILDYLQIGNRMRGMKDIEIAKMLNQMEQDIFQSAKTEAIIDSSFTINS